jgi:anti-anti-sigma factor
MSKRFVPWPGISLGGIEATCSAPDTARVTVVGEVDLATAPALRTALLRLLADHHPTALVVDLDAVTFLDCAGLSALVAARNAAIGTGRQVRVTNPQPIVRRVLDLTGLSDVFMTTVN